MILSPASQLFLSQFGGLLIKYSIASWKWDDVLGFYANEAVINFKYLVESTEEEFGVGRLCPLGYYMSGMRLLLQSDTGAIYGSDDEYNTLIGDSGEEAIENIISGKEPKILTHFVWQQNADGSVTRKF